MLGLWERTGSVTFPTPSASLSWERWVAEGKSLWTLEKYRQRQPKSSGIAIATRALLGFSAIKLRTMCFQFNVHLFNQPFNYLSIHQLIHHPSIYQPFTYLFIFQSTHHPFTLPPIHPSTIYPLFIDPSTHLSIQHQFTQHPSIIYPSIYSSSHPSNKCSLSTAGSQFLA